MIELDRREPALVEIDDDGRVDQMAPPGEAAELAASHPAGPCRLRRRGLIGGQDGVELAGDLVVEPGRPRSRDDGGPRERRCRV